MKFLEKLTGDPNKKYLKQFQPIVDEINALEEKIEKLSDDELKAQTPAFKKRLEEGETLDDILPEAFATVREVGRRLMGMRHYDVQLIGGLALHNGMVAEMRTGEGKTLVATLPTYLNALEGKGVHVVTVNDYLAKRDAVWMGQIYDFLGLSVGIIQGQRITYIYDAAFQGGQEGGDVDEERDETGSFHVENEYLRKATRQEAYACDITYGTNNEFGFDYLRDNMVQDLSQMVMRAEDPMHYTIIDEVDSILIDEARTPLIISAPAEEATDQYYHFAKLVRQLNEETDYNVDEKLRSATLTEEGIAKLEKALNVENLYVAGGIRMVHHIEQALKAEVLFKRDKDYIVEENEVVIIDEFTGRKMPGRRYSEGLHQAIEAKENVAIKRESRTLATITFQNLFRMYGKLSGMTGTAETEKEELYKIYQLDVFVIPTNEPDKRIDHPDRIYKNEAAKFKAIAQKIREVQEKGQPILVGTASVEKNEALAAYLESEGVQFEALNAKNHEREGEIVAQAGVPGAVTLATNMAGRGVDIKLGGNPGTPEGEAKAKEAGGLFVLGTERHESRRIDNQLRGRSARQGDPGETQFFVSTEDDMMRIFAGDRMKNVMERLNVPDDMPIEQKMISRILESAQTKVEGHNFDIRKHLLQYDDILNRQRHALYNRRRKILELADGQQTTDDGQQTTDDGQNQGEEETVDRGLSTVNQHNSLKEMILDMIEGEIELVVSFHTNPDNSTDLSQEEQDWNMKEIFETMRTIFPFTKEEEQQLMAFGEDQDNDSKLSDVEARNAIVEFLLEKATAEYTKIEEHIQNSAHTLVQSEGEEQQDTSKLVRNVEKNILLRAIDTLWVDHLVAIDHLRKSIGLRGYAQRDPLIEYKRETYHMYHALEASIQKEVVYSFFKVGLGLQMAPTVMASDKLTLSGAKKSAVNTTTARSAKRTASGEKIGRNTVVKISNGTQTKEMKFKKAEPLIQSGDWQLV